MNRKKEEKEVYVDIRSKNIGFKFKASPKWIQVKRSEYKKLNINSNTLYLFNIDNLTTLSIMFVGFASDKNFDSNYHANIKRLPDDVKVIFDEDYLIKELDVKQVVLEKDFKKLLQSFVLINGMIINFTINLDTADRVFNAKQLRKDKNVIIMNEILNSLQVFKPVNPPQKTKIDIPTEEIPEKKTVIDTKAKPEIVKNTAQKMIEQESSYRNIKVPKFYFKYEYKDAHLSIINDEIYFEILNSDLRIIEKSYNLANRVKNCISSNLANLSIMDHGNLPFNKKDLILTRVDDNYLLIDLSKDNLDEHTLQMIFVEIFDLIDGKIENDLSDYDIFPYKLDFKNIDGSSEFKPVEEKISVIEEVEEPIINIVDDTPKPELEEDSLLKMQMDIADVLDMSKPKPVKIDVNPEITTFDEEEKEAKKKKKTKSKKDKKDEIIDTHEQDYNKISSSDVKVFYHIIENCPIFKFNFPKENDSKIDREFNVFDVLEKDDINYRVFIFRCVNNNEYEIKVNDWMSKNVISSQTGIKSYNEKTLNDRTIRTYVLDNERIYKVSYIEGYLIAVSSVLSNMNLAYADYALATVSLIESDESFKEALKRKLNSIEILKSQGISYLEELPLIESSYSCHKRTVDEVAKRAIALCLSCNFACDVIRLKKKKQLKDSKKFFNKLLATYRVTAYLTPNEKRLFDTMDKSLAVQISWQFEGLLILLWSLNLVDRIPYPHDVVDSQALTSIISSNKNYSEFITKCTPRDINEILDLADLTYRYDWYCIDSRINSKDISDIINSEIVLERHRALNWLILDEEWDNVDLST